MQFRYQIHICHDGATYVANVLEIPGCCGRGQTYAEALHDVERAMSIKVNEIRNTGSPLPAPIPPAMAVTVFTERAKCNSAGKGKTSIVKSRMQQKFGNLSNRGFAARVGIFGPDAPIIFSNAAGGGNSRQSRCVIALVLETLPSTLWPHLPSEVLADDDRYFVELRKKQDQGNSI